MKCYKHPEADAVGTCVHCGKFICEACNTEIDGRYYCKDCVDDVFQDMQEKMQRIRTATARPAAPAPTVYMNAGGAAASSSAAANGRRGRRQSCLLHIILFLFTAGIGNIIYYLWARSRD